MAASPTATPTATFPRLAALAVFSIGALPALCSAAGGTIRFSGELVADSYDAVVAPSKVVTAVVSDGSVRTASTQTAEIMFPSGGGDRKSATVSTIGLGGTPLDARCGGAAGLPQPLARCHLGLAGGRLAIAVRGDARAGVAPGAIVTVAYD